MFGIGAGKIQQAQWRFDQLFFFERANV